MADKAQSEPTMEEILASIRKIIADDGPAPSAGAQDAPQASRSVDVNVSEDDDFDDLSLDDVVAETESDEVNGPEEDFFAQQEKSRGEADFDLMETEDASGSLLSDDDMFEDLSAEGSTSGEADFAPEAPQPFETEDDDLEDFGLETFEDKPSIDAPAFEEAARSPGATWSPQELAAPQTEADTEDYASDESEYELSGNDDGDWSTEETFEDTSFDTAAPLEGVAPQPEPVDQGFTPEPQTTDFTARFDPAPPVEVEPETEPAVAEFSPPQPEPEPQMTEQPTSSAQTGGDALTDERIAGAAATALGKLMVKRSAEEEANPNTLDGLMRELLRPMIKEWLDANLPTIVERKVEEEVQRIARMAR
ncbi:DUF2497 domain-containing protein [Thalassovita mediterranea]|nr:DUF2497 domain-containing protein [Thalassovita mediterranea]